MLKTIKHNMHSHWMQQKGTKSQKNVLQLISPSLKHPLAWTCSIGTLQPPLEKLKNAQSPSHLPEKCKATMKPKPERVNRSRIKPLREEVIPTWPSDLHCINPLARRPRKAKKNYGRQHNTVLTFFPSASLCVAVEAASARGAPSGNRARTGLGGPGS